MKRLLALIITLSLTATAFAADDGFKPLFNAKDTMGWYLRNKKQLCLDQIDCA